MGESSDPPLFDPESTRDVPWLADLYPCPEDAAWPTFMTPPHPAATGSHGLTAEAWIREELGISLRWWQRLAMRRQLEHDKAGGLVWQTVLESTPRRSGKSVRMKCSALWRVEHADLFGEQQLVLLTGKDLAICLEHHRRSWRWAESRGWTVQRKNGYESVERPDGSRWIVRGRNSVYGYDVTMGCCDEAWDVTPMVVDEGLEPALLERSMPQLVLTSTAHRRATPLMRRRIDAALSGMGEDFETLLLLWSAPKDADIEDEKVWRAASPHWSEHRRKLIAGKVERALRGEADPEADDVDPIEGLRAQYLNTWPSAPVGRQAGEPVVSEIEWAGLDGVKRPVGPPAVVAVESHFSSGVSVGSAWPLGGGDVLVGVEGYPTLAEAARAARAAAAPVLLVGKSLADDPVFEGVVVEPVGDSTRNVAIGLRELIDDELFHHDGGVKLTEQVLGLRTVPSAEGPRVRSTGASDAVKVAVWAGKRARRPVGVPQIW